MSIYTESETKDAKYPIAKAYEAASFIIQDRTGKPVKLTTTVTDNIKPGQLFTLAEINHYTSLILAAAWTGSPKPIQRVTK